MGTEFPGGLSIRKIKPWEIPGGDYHTERVESGKKGGKRGRGRKKKRPIKKFVPRKYKKKKFIAWDGEGISDSGDTWQRYIVLGNSEGDFLLDHDLDTEVCFDLMLEAAEKYPNAIHIIFGMDYDINMICRGMDKLAVKVLHKKGEIYNWKGYHVEYIPKKLFRIWKHKRYGGKGKKVSFTLFDVFTFFSCSFVKALRQYDAVPESEITEIESGKNHRGDFSDAEIHTVILPYWRKELRSLVLLVEKLEESLSGAYIDLDSYHGPGAVADYLLRKFNVQSAMPTYIPNEDLQHAIQCAYAGGRFEQFQIGSTNERVWQYDIRSAYPYAISKLPNLHGAKWEHRDRVNKIEDWSLYRIEDFFDGDEYSAKPFFYRTKSGNIIYPSFFKTGWYYGIECRTARELGFKFTIKEAWILKYDNSGLAPFRWVGTIYQQRANWKRDGNPAEKAAKLGINSLYGKFAQRVGGNTESPKWHVLEWAGMVTAHCRSQLFRAIKEAGESVIAVETDSIFSLKELDLPVSEKLGDWEAKEISGLTYLQSGIYFSDTRLDVSKVDKYRGLAPGTLDVERVKEYLEHPTKEGIPVSVHRFRTMGSAIISSYENWPGDWCRWIDLPKMVDPLSTQSKRIHPQNYVGKGSRGIVGLERLMINPFVNTNRPSEKHKLEWIDGEETIERESYDYSD